MKKRTAVAGVVIVGILVAVVIVAPISAGINGPANDYCENAELVLPGSVTSGSTSGASIDTGYPSPCGNDAGIAVGGVWYTVVGTGDMMTASTCSTYGGSANYDTQISVYCPTCAAPVCVDGNNDDCSGDDFLSSTVHWCSRAGETYYVLVHGSAGETGEFRLSIQAGFDCFDPVPCGTAVGGETIVWDWWPF
jgi:hypothetical protein